MRPPLGVGLSHRVGMDPGFDGTLFGYPRGLQTALARGMSGRMNVVVTLAHATQIGRERAVLACPRGPYDRPYRLEVRADAESLQSDMSRVEAVTVALYISLSHLTCTVVRVSQDSRTHRRTARRHGIRRKRGKRARIGQTRKTRSIVS